MLKEMNGSSVAAVDIADLSSDSISNYRKRAPDFARGPPEKVAKGFLGGIFGRMANWFNGKEDEDDEEDIVDIDEEEERPPVIIINEDGEVEDADEIVLERTVERESPSRRESPARTDDALIGEASTEEDEIDEVQVAKEFFTPRSRVPFSRITNIVNDDAEEILDVTPSTSFRTARHSTTPISPSHPLPILSPEISQRVQEYVTQQSAHSGLNHSPAPSSRSISVLDDDLGAGSPSTRPLLTDSPAPEDSASRQHTPRGSGRVPLSAKRDSWARRRPFDSPLHKINKSSPYSISKKTPNKASENIKQYFGSQNVDLEARDRYAQLLAAVYSGPSITTPSSHSLLPAHSTIHNIHTPSRTVAARNVMAVRDYNVAKQTIRDVLDRISPPVDDKQTTNVDNASSVIRTPVPINSSPPSNNLYNSHSGVALRDLDRRLQELQIEGRKQSTLHDQYREKLHEDLEKAKELTQQADLLASARLERERNSIIDIRKKLKLKGIVIPYPEKKEDEFPPLSDEAQDLCDRAWGRCGNEQEVFRKGTPSLTRKDLKTLAGLNWLNDEVINCYIEMVCRRGAGNEKYPKAYAFNTFFYQNISTKGFDSVKRWTRKVDVFSFDVLIVPVHLSVHWCMAIVDLGEKKIDYYDSLGGDNWQAIDLIKDYLQRESMDKKKAPFSFHGWQFSVRKDIPRQKNGSDCGVFSCKFADFAARRKEIEFDQSHMAYYRQRMIFQLVKDDLAAH